jgi:hypothetical protein
MTVDQLSDSLMYQKFLGIESEKNLKRLLDAGQKDLVLRINSCDLLSDLVLSIFTTCESDEKLVSKEL